MTTLRQRALEVVANWKRHDIYGAEEVYHARLTNAIHAALEQVVEECAKVADEWPNSDTACAIAAAIRDTARGEEKEGSILDARGIPDEYYET